MPPNWFGDLWNVIVGTSGVSTGADVGLAPPVSSGPYAPPTSQPTTPYSPGMQLPAPVNTALGWLANSTARAGATLGIAANPASKDFLSLSSAWRDAVNVSPGQALAALPGTSPLTTGRDLGTKYGVNTGVAGGIDPTDPAVRKAAFESGGVGELTSWTGDAIFQYYANPQVLGGQALRPLFRYAQGTKVLGPEELAAARTSTAELVAAKTQGPEAVKVLSSRQRGLSDFLDNVRDNPGLATYHPLAAKSTNPNLVVGVLSSPAVTEEERVAAVLSGWGDTVSAQWLETRAPDVKTALDNANAALTDAEKVSKAPIPLYDPVTGKVTMNDYITDPAELVKARADVEALKARSAWYRAATGGNDEPGIYQAMRGHSLSPFQPVNIARTRMAGTRAARTAPQTGYWAEQKLSPLGETGPMVRFVAWMGGGAPKGYIAVNGAAAFDSHLDVIAGMQKAGMTPAFIDSHLKDYVAQNTANGRELVAARIDKDTIRAMFLNKLGHDAAQAEIDNTTKYVDDFMSAYQAKRQNVLEQARNEKGYIHDIESNQSTHVQALEPQQPQIIPMTDYVLVQRALNEMGQGEWDRVRGGLFKTGQGALDKLAPLWKANVLLRIGAMPRNNGESWLATWTFLGRFAGSPLSGSANIVANRADAVIARYVDKQGRVNVPGIEANLSTKDAVSTLQHNVNQLEQHRAMLLQAKETNQAFLDSAVTPEQWRTEVAQRASTEATAAYPRGPVLFHGTGTRFTEDQLAPSGFQDSGAGNLFGFGFYTTDSAEVAAGYTTKGGATNPAVYSVHWNGITAPKMLDLDAAAPSDLQNMFREWSARLEIDDHIRAALAGSPSTGELIRALRSDLAESGVTRAEADEYLGDVASWVQSSGYDGLRHAGGLFRGASKTTHDVHIFFDNSQLSVTPHVPLQPSLLDGDLTGSRLVDAATDLQAANTHIAALDARIQIIRQDMQTLAKPTAQRVRRSPGRGIQYTSTGVPFEGAGMGVKGKIMEANISSEQTNQILASGVNSRSYIARANARFLKQTGNIVDFTPEMGDAYYHAMAEWANRYAHNSAFTKKLWETNDPEALTQWLLHDPAGQAAKEKLILPAQDEEHVRQWVYNMAHNVNATIPDDLMRAHIVDREITAEQVAGYLHGRTDLQPVPYKEYTPDVIVGGEHLNRLVDKAYKYMWSMPENRLNRYPLYRTMYDNEVNRIVGDNMDQLVGRPDAEVRAWVSKYAQQPAALYAQAMVKKVVYNVERRALPAEKLRFISPFAQVTGNRLYFYGSQALENPQNIARLFVGWNAIGTTTDSSTGEKIFHIHLPGWLAKWVGQEDLPTLAVSKTSLNLISNSDPWWSPGFGPAVTIPAAEYMRHYAYQPNKSWLRTLTGSKGVGMFQNDYYGTDWMDLLSNSWERRIRASEGQQWANNSATIMAIENWKFDNGMRDKAPTMQEVADRTNALWAFRIVGAFVSPTQFTVHNDVVDEYTTKYREYSKKYGQQADQKFLADYPEYYNLVLNYSQNQTGIAATGGAADRADKHSTLLGDLQDPSMAAMVTNLPSDNGQFESTAYSYEYGHPLASGSSQVIRGPQDPQSVVENRYISKGWDMYRDAVKERNALLYAEGFHSDSQSGAEWIKAIYDQKIADITKATTVHKGDGTSYSPWAEQLGTTNPNLFANRAADLGRIVRDLSKDPANKGIYPWLPAAISYLQLRAQFQQTLAGQDAAGGSADLNARSNAWLKTIWEDQTKQLGDQNPQWADWASRYFTNDNLGSVPGG